MLDIVLIRHAESFNNAIYAQIRDALGLEYSEEAFEAEEKKLRKADPDLSTRGQRQASLLGTYFAQQGGLSSTFGVPSETEWSVYSSPMDRCLKTSEQIARSLPDIRVNVRGDLYESGGCFENQVPEVEGASCTTIGKPGRTAVQVEAEYGASFSCVPGLMENGWYYGHDAEETNEEFKARSLRVVEWLFAMHADSVANASRRGIVLVIHGNLISAIINGLISKNSSVHQALFVHNNTGYTHLQLLVEGSHSVVSMQALNRVHHLLQQGESGLLSGNHARDDHWIQEFTPLLE